MSTKIMFEYVVRDKEGRIIKRGKTKGHSFVENYGKLLAQLFAQNDTFKLIPRGDTEKIFNKSDITTCTVVGVQSEDTNFHKYGIIVGSDTTTSPTPTQTDLVSPIEHSDTGLSYGDVVVGAYGEEDTYASYFTFSRTFTNNSGDIITIGEVGLACKLTSTNANNPGDYYILLARDLLSEAVDVPPAGSITFTAKIWNAA